jgi:tyrosine-protein phosphatase YwqE
LTTQTRKHLEGLGDTIEKVTQATGIKKLVKFIAGDDCGCDDRKVKLNKIFPYNKPECLEENEYNYLADFFSKPKTMVKPDEQKELVKIYNRVLHYDFKTTSCGSCFRGVLNKLETLFNQYK